MVCRKHDNKNMELNWNMEKKNLIQTKQNEGKFPSFFSFCRFSLFWNIVSFSSVTKTENTHILTPTYIIRLENDPVIRYFHHAFRVPCETDEEKKKMFAYSHFN